jgi:hypothetical protein
MTQVLRFDLNDRQSIREASIKYMLGAYGADQAINVINTIAARNNNTKELAASSIEEIQRLAN